MTAAGDGAGAGNGTSANMVLAICCLSMFIVGLDTTIVNVALPSIKDDLHASIAGAQWTLDGYTLALACFLILAGSLGDRFGRQTIFRIGIGIFTLGSLLCSIAPNLGFLIAFRSAQAVGGCMMNPNALSLISGAFEDSSGRARAIGWWGAIAGLSLACGPLLGGLLVDAIGWRSIFLINLPVGIAAIALTTVFIPESRAPHPRKIDPVGQTLAIGGLGLLTFAIIEAPAHGIASTAILGCFGAALACLAGFLWWEPRRSEPLLDLRFFRSVPFAGASLICLVAFVTMGGFLFLSALYLQDVRGFSAIVAGLFLLPMALGMAVLAPLSGRLVARRGARPSLVLGATAIALSGVIPAVRAEPPSDPVLLISYVLIGAGLGLVNSAVTNVAVSGMPRSQSGVAAAISSTSRQIGIALGVAVFGAVLAHYSPTLVAGPGFDKASRIGWLIIVGCGLTAALLGLLTTTRKARLTATRNATRMGLAAEH